MLHGPFTLCLLTEPMKWATLYSENNLNFCLTLSISQLEQMQRSLSETRHRPLHLFLPWQTHVFMRRFRIILGPSSTMQHCWLFSAIWTEKLALTNFKKKIAAPYVHTVHIVQYSTLICLDRMILICMHGYQFVAYTKWGKSLFFNIFYTFFV